MSIIISKDGKHARKLDRQVIHQEDYLQQYIDRNSDCIPLHDLKENFRLLPLIREFTTPRGGCIDLEEDASICSPPTPMERFTSSKRSSRRTLTNVESSLKRLITAQRYGAIHRSFSRDWKIWIGGIGCWVFWAAMKTHYRIVSRQSSEMPGWVASSLSC